MSGIVPSSSMGRTGSVQSKTASLAAKKSSTASPSSTFLKRGGGGAAKTSSSAAQQKAQALVIGASKSSVTTKPSTSKPSVTPKSPSISKGKNEIDKKGSVPSKGPKREVKKSDTEIIREQQLKAQLETRSHVPEEGVDDQHDLEEPFENEFSQGDDWLPRANLYTEIKELESYMSQIDEADQTLLENIKDELNDSCSLQEDYYYYHNPGNDDTDKESFKEMMNTQINDRIDKLKDGIKEHVLISASTIGGQTVGYVVEMGEKDDEGNNTFLLTVLSPKISTSEEDNQEYDYKLADLNEGQLKDILVDLLTGGFENTDDIHEMLADKHESQGVKVTEDNESKYGGLQSRGKERGSTVGELYQHYRLRDSGNTLEDFRDNFPLKPPPILKKGISQAKINAKTYDVIEAKINENPKDLSLMLLKYKLKETPTMSRFYIINYLVSQNGNKDELYLMLSNIPFEKIKDLMENVNDFSNDIENNSLQEGVTATIHELNENLSVDSLKDFFNDPLNQNMETIRELLDTIDWSKIKPQDSTFSEEHSAAITNYTTDYSVNTFMREEMWKKDAKDVENEAKNKDLHPVAKRTKDLYVSDPVGYSINAIIKAATLQEALCNAPSKIEGEDVYRSINFSNPDQVEVAIMKYLPEGFELPNPGDPPKVLDCEQPLKESAFTSTSLDFGVVTNINNSGVSFASNNMITFMYSGKTSKGVNIDDLSTAQGQAEVLFPIGGIEGNVTAVECIEASGGKRVYRLYCELS